MRCVAFDIKRHPASAIREHVYDIAIFSVFYCSKNNPFQLFHPIFLDMPSFTDANVEKKYGKNTDYRKKMQKNFVSQNNVCTFASANRASGSARR